MNTNTDIIPAVAGTLTTDSTTIPQTVKYTRRVHMCQSVRGPLMNWTKRDWKNATTYITPEGGGRCTADELKAHFLKLLADGNEVIPIGDCDNFDPKTGCRGHQI